MKKLKKLLLLILFSAALSGCGGALISKTTPPVLVPEPTEPKQHVVLSIYAAGDIMAHAPQQASALQKYGSYDFNENYQYVKPIIEQADIAICNIEMTFAGKPYAGYPRFSAPDEIAAAVKNAGFDIAVTANNHAFDNGAAGVKRTIEVLTSAGFQTTGTFASPDDKKYLLVSVKGVIVAIISATFESGNINGNIAINGIAITKDSAKLINSFFGQDIKKYEDLISQAKKEGAEIVICYFHWGTEYQTLPEQAQKDIALKLAAAGADIIFGSHPHMIQGFEVLKLKDKQIPVYYSLGNFISNQRKELMGQSLSENGIIAQVNLTFDTENKKIIEISSNYTPTWVDKYFQNGRYVYQIVPLIGDFKNNPPIPASGRQNQAEQALKDIKKIIDK